jgi:curved DNA-binding protein CbpA
MPAQDPYAVLGVAHNASPAEIKRAYRKLALRHHPDKNPDDPNATAMFQKINAAFETITSGNASDTYETQSASEFTNATPGANHAHESYTKYYDYTPRHDGYHGFRRAEAQKRFAERQRMAAEEERKFYEELRRGFEQFFKERQELHRRRKITNELQAMAGKMACDLVSEDCHWKKYDWTNSDQFFERLIAEAPNKQAPTTLVQQSSAEFMKQWGLSGTFDEVCQEYLHMSFGEAFSEQYCKQLKKTIKKAKVREKNDVREALRETIEGAINNDHKEHSLEQLIADAGSRKIPDRTTDYRYSECRYIRLNAACHKHFGKSFSESFLEGYYAELNERINAEQKKIKDLVHRISRDDMRDDCEKSGKSLEQLTAEAPGKQMSEKALRHININCSPWREGLTTDEICQKHLGKRLYEAFQESYGAQLNEYIEHEKAAAAAKEALQIAIHLIAKNLLEHDRRYSGKSLKKLAQEAFNKQREIYDDDMMHVRNTECMGKVFAIAEDPYDTLDEACCKRLGKNYVKAVNDEYIKILDEHIKRTEGQDIREAACSNADAATILGILVNFICEFARAFLALVLFYVDKTRGRCPCSPMDSSYFEQHMRADRGHAAG